MAATLPVFFSYIDQDMAYANQITLILKALRHDFRIEVTTQQAQPNDSTADPNMALLGDCELAIVLLSRAYLRSEYMRRRLLPAVVRRMEAGDCLVLPIYVEATGQPGSALTGARVARIPHQPLKKYADPTQGYLIVESSLRKFLKAQGYSRFDRAPFPWWVVVWLLVIGLLVFGGIWYWKEQWAPDTPPARPVPVVAEPPVNTTPDEEPSVYTAAAHQAPLTTALVPCTPPAIFSGPGGCIAVGPTARGYRICKANKVFFVLTPACKPLRLSLNREQHRRIYEADPFANGRSLLYFRDDPHQQPFPALWVDTSGRVFEWVDPAYAEPG